MCQDYTEAKPSTSRGCRSRLGLIQQRILYKAPLSNVILMIAIRLQPPERGTASQLDAFLRLVLERPVGNPIRPSNSWNRI